MQSEYFIQFKKKFTCNDVCVEEEDKDRGKRAARRRELTFRETEISQKAAIPQTHRHSRTYVEGVPW